MVQPSLPPFRRTSASLVPLVLLLASAVIALGVGAFLLLRQGSQTTVAGQAAPAFDFQSVQGSAPQAPAAPQAQAPAVPAGPVDSTSLLRNQTPMAGYSGSSGKNWALAPDESAREKQFLAQHDAAILKYQQRLNEIGLRYYHKHPIVQEVDAKFATLDRYMAIKRRYEADRDLYKWSRETVALPEVRETIKKFLSRPEAWRVAVDMALDALKNPPPPSVYKEIQRVMTHDPAMVDFTRQVAEDVKPNLKVGLVGLMGKDLRPIQGVLTDLSIGKTSQR